MGVYLHKYFSFNGRRYIQCAIFALDGGIAMKKRSNTQIELWRFIACIMIVFTHAAFPFPFGAYVGAYARFAVPFFLMITGYFSYGASDAKIVKKLFDTLRIIIIGGSICFIWNSINSFFRYGSFSHWFNAYVSKRTLIEFVLYNRAIFFNSVFYYLFMLVYIYIFYLAFLKLRLTYNKFMLITVFVLILISWYIDHFTAKDWYYVGNAFFTGIPLFLIGYSIHAYSDFLLKIKNHEILIIFIGLLCTCLEFLIKQTGNYVYIGQIVVAAMLLCYCLNNPKAKSFHLLAFCGTNLSLYIMIIHCEVRDTLSLFLDNGSYSFPIVVLLSTILAASFFILLSRTRLCH